MNRYFCLAIAALVFSLPQVASAESVSFGAKLSGDGGHIGGSASGSTGSLTGKIHWSGTSIDVHSGYLFGNVGFLEGTVTRSKDKSLEGQAVSVYFHSGISYVLVSLPNLPIPATYDGTGHVTIR